MSASVMVSNPISVIPNLRTNHGNNSNSPNKNVVSVVNPYREAMNLQKLRDSLDKQIKYTEAKYLEFKKSLNKGTQNGANVLEARTKNMLYYYDLLQELIMKRKMIGGKRKTKTRKARKARKSRKARV